jgi:catechol 2,3-dioxygenase-like lactoylglutathione lyase family enzyme
MLDHVGLWTGDLEASAAFYGTVLRTLGLEPDGTGGRPWWQDLGLAPAAGRPTRGLHIGFSAPSHAHVEAFWRAGTEAGYRDDGAPGPRPEYGDDYFGAFLLDPDGNSAEAVHHGSLRRGGIVDHLWIRVADVAVSRGFYVALAPHAGLRLRTDTPERVQFAGATGSFSLVAGEPTERMHLAFPAAGEAAVQAFRAAAAQAGGEQAETAPCHPGCSGACVLDPDGNELEVVAR